MSAVTPRPVCRLLVLGEWASVIEPTPEEKGLWRRAITATLSPTTVGLTPRRCAEIAAWVDQVDRLNDARYLHALDITPWEDL